MISVFWNQNEEDAATAVCSRKGELRRFGTLVLAVYTNPKGDVDLEHFPCRVVSNEEAVTLSLLC